jgi:hypothetical protein
MAITKLQRQRGLKETKALADFAARITDVEFKSDIYRVVERARKRYGYTRDQKLAEILKYIDLGARVVNDLVNETAFTKQYVAELLRDLERGGKIDCEYIQINPTGPKTAVYRPTRKPVNS